MDEQLIAMIAAGLGMAGSVAWVLLGWAGIRSLRDIGNQLRGRELGVGDGADQNSLPSSEQSDKEQELLLAIRERGGRITAAEAAMETSLGTEEAERMLSDLANKGHLLVEGQGGVLTYLLHESSTRFISTVQA